MGKIQTRPWDAADYLETEEDIVLYLEAAFEDGDPGLIAAALGDVARAKGIVCIQSFVDRKMAPLQRPCILLGKILGIFS